MKKCTRCLVNKNLTEFYKGQSYCKDCNKELSHIHYEKNRERYIEYAKKYQSREGFKEYNRQKAEKCRYKKLYGIVLEDYNKLFKEQEGNCAICGKRAESEINKKLCVDHNHSTKKVRGLLCVNCNHGLGKFKDDIKIIRKVLEYLLIYS